MTSNAIILCGGLGSRITKISEGLPKSLLPLTDTKAIIDFQIECLLSNGIKNLVLVTGYQSAKIESYTRSHRKFIEIKIIEDNVMEGTLGALKLANQFIDNETIMLYGDLLIDIDLNELIKFRLESESLLTISCHSSNHLYDSDTIEVAKDSEKVISVESKNKEKTLNNTFLTINGVFALSERFGKIIQNYESKDFSNDLIPQLISHGYKVNSHRTSYFVKDVGTPERIIWAREIISKNMFGGFAKPRPVIFLDRDGTINEEIDYIDSVNKFMFKAGAAEGIKLLNQMGFMIVVVTNQPGVAKGFISEENLRKIHDHMEFKLAEKSAKVDLILYCIHHPEKGHKNEVAELKVQCDCRKPENGLFERVVKKFNVDVKNSWMVGDTWRDKGFAQKSELRFAKIGPDSGDFESIFDFANQLSKKIITC